MNSSTLSAYELGKGAHAGSAGGAVRYRRGDVPQVQVIVREAAYVAQVTLGQIRPVERRPDAITFGRPLAPAAERGVQPAPQAEAEAIGAPVQVVAVLAVCGVSARIATEILPVDLERFLDLRPLARLHPRAVKGDFEAAFLKVASVARVLGIIECVRSLVPALPRVGQRPHGLGGTKPESVQQFINRPDVLERCDIGVVEDRESELFAAGE